MAELGQKKERNWLLDVTKYFMCIAVFLDHDIMFNGTGRHMGVLNPVVENSYLWSEMNGDFFGFTGIYSIGFFTFLCGYWFINSFKNEQKLGIHRAGREFKLTSACFGKNLSGYWPALFFGQLLPFVLFVVVMFPSLWTSEGIIGLWKMIRNDLFYLSGFQAFGFTTGEGIGLHGQKFAVVYEATEGLTNGTDYIFMWNTSLWYMSALICFVALWYFIFLKSETFGVYAWVPMNMALLLGFFSKSTGYADCLALSIPTEYARLFGEFAFGVFGWYVSDWLRKNCKSKKSIIAVTVWETIAFVQFWVMQYFGCGGQPFYYIITFLWLVPMMSGVGNFTKLVNSVLKFIPGKEYLGPLCLGFYLGQAPMNFIIGYFNYCPEVWPWFASLNFEGQALMGILFLTVFGMLYVFIDKYVLSHIAKFISKAFRCKETITEFVEIDKGTVTAK